jgi:hypothetical protein
MDGHQLEWGRALIKVAAIGNLFFVVFEKIIVGDNERSSSRAMNAAIYTRRHALRPVHFTLCYSRSRTGSAR